MVDPAAIHQYTHGDYLRLEEDANVKHEFLAGEIYAMAGGTPEHAVLAVNLSTLLNLGLRERPCRVFSSDLRVRVIATGLTTYPDVSVVCGRIELDPEDRNTVTNPLLLVEVTSSSSENYDRGAKLGHYQQIASVREILVVSHREPQVEAHRRGEDGSWTVETRRSGESLRLSSVGVDLAVDEVYRNALDPAG